MKRILFTWLAISIFMVITPPLSSYGADYGGKIRKANYVSAKAGAFFPTSDLSDLGFESGFNAEVAVGHHVSDSVAVELGVGYFEAEGEDAGIARDISVIPITATAKYSMPIAAGDAYVGAGAGLYWARLEQKIGPTTTRDNDVVPGGHFMGGANFDIAKDMYVGVEGKWIFTDDANFFGQGVELGGAILTGNFGVRF